jgi:small conductance mechanosensitive channel
MTNQSAVIKSPEVTEKIILYFVEHGMQILTAIVIMGIGLFIARWVGNVIHRWLRAKAFDEPVSALIVKIIKLLIIVSIGIMALGQMGVQITPLIAGIGVAGVGQALQCKGSSAILLPG